MGVDIQIYRCRIGQFNCGAGPKLLDKSKVSCDVACGISAIGAVCFIGILLTMAGVEPNPGPTGAYEENDPKCKNWSRVAYGYRYVKTGLIDFISGQIGDLHFEQKGNVRKQGNVRPCSGCTINTLLPDHGTVSCNHGTKSVCLCKQDPGTRKKCPKKFCGRFYHLIVDDHVEKSPRWSNTDPTKWYTDHFQYAKCFLGTDTTASSMSDLDCADLLAIVINNERINHNSIKNMNLFHQCWKDHYKIFNSGNFEVTTSELTDYFVHMEDVLKDGKCLFEDPDAMQAVEELQKLQLKHNLMQLSDEDIDELLQKTAPIFVFRYQYLLIEIGTKVIKQVFDVQVNQNFEYYLKHNTDEKNKPLLGKLKDLIKKKCITTAQARYLPPKDNNPSSRNFDISLLTCLLRNVCGLRPAEDQIWKKTSGYSVEEDITRLRNCRNDLSHTDTVFISSTDFTTKWNELCEILKRLNQGLEEKCRVKDLQKLIDKARTHCIDENERERFTEILNVWKEMDAEMKVMRSKMDSMDSKVDSIDSKVESTDSDVTKIQEDVEMVKVELKAHAQSIKATNEAVLLLLAAAKKNASDGQEQTCFTEEETAYNDLASEMKKNGVGIHSVVQGSILITFSCPTRLALERLRQYIDEQKYEEKLAVLENAVSKCIKCPVKLNLSIVPEHTSSAVMQTDIATSKKSVVLTLKCRGSEGVRNAVGFLTNGSSTKSLKKLSEALSRSVGEKITLLTTVIDQPSPDGNIAHQEDQYKYVFRYKYLLVEIGTAVMRKVFDVKVGSDFVKHLSSNNNKFYKKLQSLISAKIITADQAQYLPPIDMSPQTAKFDITLLACLLRNVCGLRGHADLVWKNPPPTDLSVAADLARLNECRKNLQHSGRVFISETDLTDKWNELSQILIRLNNTCGIRGLSALIDNASKMDTNEKLKDRFDQALKSWGAMDQDVISKLDQLEKSGADGHARTEKTVEQGVVSLQKEMQQRISTVQQDVQQGMSTVQQEVQQGLSSLQQDVATVQQGLRTVQPEMKLKRFLTVDAKVIQEKLMTIYQRDCRLLQVSPFIEDDNEDLISIYQSPTLHHAVNDSDQAKGKQETISSYEDIFCKDDKTFKRVYITGDAGVGKTSLCKRMCLLWSNSRSGDYAGNDESTKRDIKFLEKFDFLFRVTLGATDRRDMIMMIVDQLFYSECDDERTGMYKLIKRILNQHDSLIVLDEYDEWNPKTSDKHDCKTPKGIESEKCVFLTMCRPFKLENVRLSLNDIDHQIEMSGIHGLSSDHYVTEVVKYMNEKTHDNKNAAQFLEEIKRCKLDDQLCIPTISSHLVVVWWSNQKLTHFSKAFLYGTILEMLFKRAEIKFDFPSIPPSDMKLPKCLSQLDNVNEHVSLLQKVCLLSFNSLFKQDECASTLVFTKKQLISKPYVFTIGEMDFLCKIGIISKNKVIGFFEDQKQILSFVNKSHIEFFSALYISSFDSCNKMDGVVKKWTSLDDVLQYQNFFQFLAGLSDQKLIDLLEQIYSLLSDHLKLWRKYAVVNYKGDYTNSYMEQFKLLQYTVVSCFIECGRFIDPNVELKLEDFIFDYNSNNDILKQILLLNTACVKSIHSVKGKYYDEFNQIKNLQCLHVGAVLSDYGAVLSGDVYDVKFTECMLQNQSTLHTVGIEGTGTLISVLPLISLQHLTSLSLSGVKMQHNSLHNLVTFLSDNDLIENIKLYAVSCDNHQYGDSDCTLTLNLPHHTKLTSLCLQYVNILCNHVNNSSLKSITLYTFAYRSDSCYIDVINCIKYSQLEHLYIHGWYGFEKNKMKAWSDTVKTLPYIKSLRLEYMELPDDVLKQLHPDVTQVKIMLGYVTMSRQCFHCFIDSCVNNKSVIKVELGNFQITVVDGKTHRELSWKVSVDYMSEYLTSIPKVNITYKDGARLHFDTGSCQ